MRHRIQESLRRSPPAPHLERLTLPVTAAPQRTSRLRRGAHHGCAAGHITAAPRGTSWLRRGRRSILFGPFAGSSPKFLRHGSMWDLPRSIDRDNFGSLLTMTKRNVPLVRLLLSELTATDRRRLAALRVFAPTARIEDWTLVAAGQRAQIVREGQLQFGTEVVAAQDGTIASVLGASPGASTAVSIAAEVLTRCFPRRLWRKRLREMTSD